MFLVGGTAGAKRKGKQATKGDAQIVRDNLATIEFYKKVLSTTNAIFLAVHFIFYFITGLFSIVSFILFVFSSAAVWYVWSWMRQIDTSELGGSVIDLNLDGSISEYVKDIILVTAIAQSTSLIHRYCW